MALDPLTAALDLGGKLIDKLFPDPAKRAEALQKLEELRQSGDLQAMAGQLEVDKVEAANPKLFVSGWRPFVGWVCGGALAVQMVVGPILGPFGVHIAQLDVSLLTTLLVGMLGLGGMRTVERLNGKANGQ